MCVFCAAVPAAATLGAWANSKQRQQIRQAEEQGKPLPRIIVPARYATAGIVSGLVICSIIYHTQLKISY
jgi:hypothetical protein